MLLPDLDECEGIARHFLAAIGAEDEHHVHPFVALRAAGYEITHRAPSGCLGTVTGTVVCVRLGSPVVMHQRARHELGHVASMHAGVSCPHDELSQDVIGLMVTMPRQAIVRALRGPRDALASLWPEIEACDVRLRARLVGGAVTISSVPGAARPSREAE